jgi:hypothetical protein
MTATLAEPTTDLPALVTAYRSADLAAYNAENAERWSEGSKAVLRRQDIADQLRATGHDELARLLRREHHARRGLVNTLATDPTDYDEVEQELDERLAHLAATRTAIRRYLKA